MHVEAVGILSCSVPAFWIQKGGSKSWEEASGKKNSQIFRITLKPRRGGREQLVTNLRSFFFCACSILLMSRESNLRRPNLLKTSDDSPEGLDGGMACLVTTRVVCVRLKQNILRSNLSFSFRQCQNSHHEIVHPNVLLWSGYENAQFPAAEHSQPVQADHIGQTIPEKWMFKWHIKRVSHINHPESWSEPESAALRLDLPVQLVISDKVDVLDP